MLANCSALFQKGEGGTGLAYQYLSHISEGACASEQAVSMSQRMPLHFGGGGRGGGGGGGSAMVHLCLLGCSLVMVCADGQATGRVKCMFANS